MIRTAPEGRWFIVGAWVVALALIAVAVGDGVAGVDRRGGVWTLLAVWVVAFFRDPERTWPAASGWWSLRPTARSSA